MNAPRRAADAPRRAAGGDALGEGCPLGRMPMDAPVGMRTRREAIRASHGHPPPPVALFARRAGGCASRRDRLSFRGAPAPRDGGAPPCGERGFTLVEMVVALFVFALLASAGVALLGFSARAQGVASERLDRIAAIRRVSALMTADLAQAVPRPSRSPAGLTEAAFAGTPGGRADPALAFIRRGWENPNEAPRASLQKVRYRLRDDRLERSVAPMLDGAEYGPPATVIRGVSRLALRYRVDGAWRDRWDAIRPDALPRAVEVVLDVKGVGTVRQVFQAGTGL